MKPPGRPAKAAARDHTSIIVKKRPNANERQVKKQSLESREIHGDARDCASPCSISGWSV